MGYSRKELILALSICHRVTGSSEAPGDRANFLTSSMGPEKKNDMNVTRARPPRRPGRRRRRQRLLGHHRSAGSRASRDCLRRAATPAPRPSERWGLGGRHPPRLRPRPIRQAKVAWQRSVLLDPSTAGSLIDH